MGRRLLIFGLYGGPVPYVSEVVGEVIFRSVLNGVIAGTYLVTVHILTCGSVSLQGSHRHGDMDPPNTEESLSYPPSPCARL